MAPAEDRVEAWVTLLEMRKTRQHKPYVYCEIQDHETLGLPKGANWFNPPDGLQLTLDPQKATLVRKAGFVNVESLHIKGRPQAMEQVDGETCPDVSVCSVPSEDDQYACFPTEDGKLDVVRLPRKLLKPLGIGRIFAPAPIQFDIVHDGKEYVATSLTTTLPAAVFASQVDNQIPVLLAALDACRRDDGVEGIWTEVCYPGASMSALVYLPAVLLRRARITQVAPADSSASWCPEDYENVFAEQEKALIAQETLRVTHFLVLLSKNGNGKLRIDRLLRPRGLACDPGSIVADWVEGEVVSPPSPNASGNYSAELLLASAPYQGDNVYCHISDTRLVAVGMTPGTKVALSIKEGKNQKYVWAAGKLHRTTPFRGDEKVNGH